MDTVFCMRGSRLGTSKTTAWQAFSFQGHIAHSLSSMTSFHWVRPEEAMTILTVLSGRLHKTQKQLTCSICLYP